MYMLLSLKWCKYKAISDNSIHRSVHYHVLSFKASRDSEKILHTSLVIRNRPLLDEQLKFLAGLKESLAYKLAW